MNTTNEADVLVSPQVDVSLAAQRENIRRKIHAQRELIESGLGGPDSEENTAYPRSHTMRFFADRPGLATKLAMQLAGVLVGARVLKSVSAAVGFAKMLR